MMKIFVKVMKLKLNVLILFGILIIGCESVPTDSSLQEKIIGNKGIYFKNSFFLLNYYSSRSGIAEMTISPEGSVIAKFGYLADNYIKTVETNLNKSDKDKLGNLLQYYYSYDSEYGDMEINGYAQFEIALSDYNNVSSSHFDDRVSIGYIEHENLPDSLSDLISKLVKILENILMEN